MDDFLKIMAALTPIVLGVLTYFTAKANANAVRASKAATAVAEIANVNAAKATDAAEQVKADLAGAAGERLVAAEEVKRTLANSTTRTDQRLNAIEEGQGVIHELVNSRLSVALEWARDLERQLFEATGRIPTGEPPAAGPTAPVPGVNPFPPKDV